MSFDHRDRGTDNAVWLAANQWSDVPALTLADVDRLVVVAAHPDDESLGAAGLVAAAHAMAIPVVVIIATAGERSHPESPGHSAERLAMLRRAEVVRAVDEVAPGARLLLAGLPDGSLRDHVDELSRLIESSLSASGSAMVAATWRDDGHPDHRAVGDGAAQAVRRTRGARLLEYPIWGWHWATPESRDWPWGRARRLELDARAVDAKNAALGRHGSQLAPLSPAAGDEAIVSPHFATHFRRDFETFFVPADADSPPERATPEPVSLARTYFDSFYEGRRDPWGFETRWYEERKRALTMASLPRRRFSSALEMGSSIGVLTAELAGRCDALLATDIAEAPLDVARQRLAGSSHVRVERRELPAEWPEGSFDLIVVSEVGYYLSPAELERLIALAAASLTADGVIVACHWRHPVAEYPLTGDAVHEAFDRASGLERKSLYRDDDLVLEVFAVPGTSWVADAEGLL